MSDLDTLVANLGTNKKPGSSVEVGVAYQDIPGFNIPYHRGNSWDRAKFLSDEVDIKGKTILDLGCSVGSLSQALLELGAKSVKAVDYDEASVALGKKLYTKVEFEVADITLDWIKKLPRYDIVVWFSQFMWLYKQHGEEYALDCLFELSKHCTTLIFETAGKDDGSAPIPYRQSQLLPLLCRNTPFQEIKDLGPWTFSNGQNDWSVRNIFKLSNPLFYAESELSEVHITDRGQVAKSYAKGKKDPLKKLYVEELERREVEFLKELEDWYPVFPKVLKQDEFGFVMTYLGPRTAWIPESQLVTILNMLKQKGVTHRDIRPENVLWNGETISLIDFTWAVREGEETNYSARLGQPYKSPYGFDDEYSLRRCQFELMQRSFKWD